MKRVVFVVNTVMTLMSSVYYATEIKKFGLDIETAMLWQNPTAHKISMRQFKNCFDFVFEIPKSISMWGILSPETIRNELLCKAYLESSGISYYLKKRYEKDVLMVGADYNGTMGFAIKIFARKFSPKRIILFEEGMALYSDKRRTLRDIIDYNRGKEIDTQPVIGGCRKVQVIFAQHPDKLPKWKCRNKRVIRQSDAFADIGLWKGILEKDAYLKELSAKLENKNVVLYLGQPINEFSSKFRPSWETELIESVLEKLPEDTVMLVKAHPRDPVNKYNKLQGFENCVVFERKAGWYPVECLLNLFKLSAVITFSSSAALNILDRIPDCRALYSYRYFGISVAGSWDEIYRSYGDRVRMPASLKEFEDGLFGGDNGENRYGSWAKRGKKRQDLMYLKYFLS